MTAHREKWPGEPYPCLSGKDRGLIKLLVEMFGPDTWARVAAMVCRDWLAFQEKYRVQATRPDIVSVFRFRNDLSALALKGGIFSRSNRNSCWGDKAAKIEITNSPIGW
jgi:hypothetical protein